MPDKILVHSRAFKENIETLLDELKLAIQWDRPSLLLAVHNSKYSQEKAQKALEASLRGLSQGVIKIVVNSESADIHEQILQSQTDLRQTVFFISNLGSGGGPLGRDSYNALNLYREFFVEEKVRLVIWLTKGEEVDLSKYAPDFWAFRHRVLEFASTHQPENMKPSAGILIWHIQKDLDTPAVLKDKIKFREDLVRELPNSPESNSTRIELFYTLGFLQWRAGNHLKAEAELRAASALLGNDPTTEMGSWILNGQSIIAYERGEYQRSFEILSTLLQAESSDTILWMNLGIVLCAVGRNHEAIAQSRKSVKLAPTHAQLWNSLGYLFLSMEKLDEAAGSFKRAIELAPTDPGWLCSLAMCYSAMGLQEEALEQLGLARKSGTGGDPFPAIYASAIQGKTAEVKRGVQEAIAAGKISEFDVRRDPGLGALIERGVIEGLR